MAKKKTTVALPGGIKNLVHTVQNSDTDAQIKRDVIAAEIAASDDNITRKKAAFSSAFAISLVHSLPGAIPSSYQT